MKANKELINHFFETKQIAIAGVSRNEKKFGNLVFKELRKRNFDLLPVNPHTQEIDGIKCYPTVDQLPEDVKSLLIVTPKKETDAVLRQAVNKGIDYIWIQQMSETTQTLAIASELNKKIIYNKCIYMYAQPVEGFHKFHRTIMKLFGKLYN